MTYLGNGEELDVQAKTDIGSAFVEMFGNESQFGLDACFNSNINKGYQYWNEVVFTMKETEKSQDNSASTEDNNNEAAKQEQEGAHSTEDMWRSDTF